MEIKILQQELETQDIWLNRAKRLIQLYQTVVEDVVLERKGNILLKEVW